MARKGSQQKNGLNQNSTNHKKGTADSARAVPNMKGRRKVSKGKFVGGVELPNANQSSKPISDSADETDHVGEEIKSKQKLRKFLGKEKEGLCVTNTVEQSVPIDSSSGDCLEMKTTAEASGSREENGTPIDHGPECATTSFGHSKNGANAEDMLGNLEFSDTVVMKFLRASALFILTTGTELLERQKPFFITLTTNVSNAACYVREKVDHAYPIVLKWFVQFGKILLLLSMVWLDCALRGVDSFLRMGTMSFFSVIWCSVFSVIAMIGMFKFAVALVITALAGRLIGFTIAIILAAICGITLLWFCGSFWMTSFIICSGGFAFAMRHEKLALLIITVYSTYCARAYAGWLGLLLALNLSFISSDALIFFMRSNVNSHRMPHQTPKQTTGMQGQPGFFSSERDSSSSETGSGPSADHSPGMPSTSGTDSEITSEDEVIRLLNCADHYSVLGLSRHESVDVSILKREYRKKAMLVHPDKNMGNEKAAEAFKKLQNAYEVLLDSVKRKAYDDELRREELLNFFRGIQNSSQRNGRHSIFGSGFARTDGDSEDPFGESKRIACRKCGNFHIWIHTKKIKLTARWCQDCKDFHQAKDGDGWVEQSSQPFLFGILQKVDAPRAYVCADSRIYDANEWYICQGMRCPANTHKPSFHVNTSLTPKHNIGKGSAPRGPMPSSNPEESMTEEQFFEWLQNAVQAGVFDHFSAGTSSDSPFSRAGNNSKTGGSYSGSGSNSKKKKKGKKQW